MGGCLSIISLSLLEITSVNEECTLIFTSNILGGIPGDRKLETTNSRSGEVKIFGSGFSSPSSLDNGRVFVT